MVNRNEVRGPMECQRTSCGTTEAIWRLFIQTTAECEAASALIRLDMTVTMKEPTARCVVSSVKLALVNEERDCIHDIVYEEDDQS